MLREALPSPAPLAPLGSLRQDSEKSGLMSSQIGLNNQRKYRVRLSFNRPKKIVLGWFMDKNNLGSISPKMNLGLMEKKLG